MVPAWQGGRVPPPFRGWGPKSPTPRPPEPILNCKQCLLHHCIMAAQHHNITATKIDRIDKNCPFGTDGQRLQTLRCEAASAASSIPTNTGQGWMKPSGNDPDMGPPPASLLPVGLEPTAF